MNLEFKNNILALLKDDKRLWSQDEKEFDEIRLLDLVDKFDERNN